jgi:N-acetylglucosamine-6-sulfatase
MMLRWAFAALGVLGLLQGCAGMPEGEEVRPDVVFVLTDDQRWDAMSCAGHPYLRTPHLDRLAEEGARFSHMFVTTSLCSPSRASYLSGLYPFAHGVLNNFTDYPKDLPSFPRRLQEAGYETAYIGKWHMGEDDDRKRPGFDYWVSHKGQGSYVDTTFNVDGERRVLPGYYTHVVTDKAVEWILKPRQKPYLLILGHKAPHSPNIPEEKYRELYDAVDIRYPETAFHLEGKPRWVQERTSTWHGIHGPLWGFRKKFPDPSPEGVKAFAEFVRAYHATVKSVDDSVGEVTRALRETGRLDRTLFVFAGDNGFFLGEHGMMDKRTMHEPSIRVPMLVRYPPLVPRPRVVNELVLNVDLAPSVLDICRARPLPRAHGMSWKRLLEGDARGWRKSFVYAYNYEKEFPYTPNVRGVRTAEWKYVHYPHGDGGPDRHKAELYDLREDPQEARNRIDDPALAAKVRKFQAELEALLSSMGALPDRMPLDEGVKTTLPDPKIR